MTVHFKIGDRVRTTDFPVAVDESRGHTVGDEGVIVDKRDDSTWVVEFDKQQGVPQFGFDNVWICEAKILAPAIPITPEAIAATLSGLAEILEDA